MLSFQNNCRCSSHFTRMCGTVRMLASSAKGDIVSHVVSTNLEGSTKLAQKSFVRNPYSLTVSSFLSSFHCCLGIRKRLKSEEDVQRRRKKKASCCCSCMSCQLITQARISHASYWSRVTKEPKAEEVGRSRSVVRAIQIELSGRCTSARVLLKYLV